MDPSLSSLFDRDGYSLLSHHLNTIYPLSVGIHSREVNNHRSSLLHPWLPQCAGYWQRNLLCILCSYKAFDTVPNRPYQSSSPSFKMDAWLSQVSGCGFWWHHIKHFQEYTHLIPYYLWCTLVAMQTQSVTVRSLCLPSPKPPWTLLPCMLLGLRQISRFQNHWRVFITPEFWAPKAPYH